MTRMLHTSTVDLSAITRQPMSCFFVVPPDRLDTYHRWVRLMLATQLLAIVRTPHHTEWPIVFLLDEFAHLGRLQPIARDIALLGGYGVTFWLFLQNLSQLRTVYGDQWTTFLANADILQAFGTNDWETAEYLSKMTGDATIRSTSDNISRGTSHGRHGSRQEGRGVTHAERGRRLLLPDEVRRLDPSQQLLFCTASDPILATKDCYYTAPQYTGQFDRNPLRYPSP
jgi:type IV secretion system protein VirD4